MKTIRLYDIEWNTSGAYDDNECFAEEIQLPSEHTVQVNNHWNPVEEAADLLSDTYHYCVKSVKWELA